MKAAEVVPEPVQEPVQEPVAAPIVESTVEEVEEEEEQQTAQEPEIQDASADEFDEEHEVELVFEREIPAAAIVIQEVKEVKEVKEEIIEEAAPAAAEVPEQAEEEPEQVQDVQEEAQVDTPTTLVGDQLEHTKETEETVQVIVETPRKTESWSDVSEDKVQTLQEVSRVARKLLFFVDAIELDLVAQSILATSLLTDAALLIMFMCLFLQSTLN